MQLIEHIEVGSGGSASITFSAIPDTYTDLVLVMSLRSDGISIGSGARLEINGSSANFTNRLLYGTGSGAFSASGSIGQASMYSGSGDTANTFNNASLYITNYRSSSAKSMSIDSVYETNATEAYQAIYAQLWNSSDPITSLLIKPTPTANWVQYSSASLYGITAGSDGIVAVS